MAAASFDEELNEVTEVESKRKIKLELAKQQDRKITVDVTVTEKSGVEYSGESSEPQRNQQENTEEPSERQEEQDQPEEDEENQDDKEEEKNPEDKKEKEGDEENPEENAEEPAEEGGPEAEEAAAEAEEGLAAGEAAGAEAAAGAGAAEAGAATAAVGAEAGAAAGAGAAAATAPVWGTILAIIAVIAAVFVFVFIILVVMVAKCNEDTWSGTGARTASTAASWVGIIPADVCEQLAINNFSGGSSGGGGATGNFDGLTDAQARAQLAAASITVNAAEPQTSLAGVKQALINEIISFKNACDAWAGSRGSCTVVVTGATETTGGHAGGPCSHLSGNKIDLRAGGLVTDYIRANFIRSGSRGSDPIYLRPGNSVSYVEEGDHWDIGGVGCV